MQKTELTKGPILGSLVRFAFPMMAGNLLQQIYSIVDTLIVGRYVGKSALAAVGASYALMTFITSLIIGLCMGSGALFSADFGRGDLDGLKKDVALSFRIICTAAIAIGVAVFPCTGSILRMLRISAELMDMTRTYVTVVFCGIIFIFLFNFYAYAMRSMGNSLLPLIVLGIASGINIALDLLFVIEFDMGIAGAAKATVIAQAFAAVTVMICAFRNYPQLRLGRALFLRDPRRSRYILINDLTTGLQQSIMNFGILMIQGLVNSFGTVIMAAFAAAVKIDTFAYMPAQEFGNAFSLFIAQNYGAGKEERIRRGTRLAMLTSGVFCMCVSLIIYVSAGRMMSLFVESDAADVIIAGTRYLRIEGVAYIGIGILFLWYGYFRAVDRPYISLLLTVISLGTRVLLAYIFAPDPRFGVNAIWLAIPTGWALADMAGFLLFRKIRKQRCE